MRDNNLLNRIKELFISVTKDKSPTAITKSKVSAHIIKETPLPETDLSNRWIETVDVSMYFPLNQGDIIELRRGKKYHICKKTITGAIENTSVTLSWINKPAMLLEKDSVERVRFKSIREMNYHLEKEQSSIVHVEKNYMYKSEPALSIEDAHQLAIEENLKRERVKQFFNALPSKKNEQ